MRKRTHRCIGLGRGICDQTKKGKVYVEVVLNVDIHVCLLLNTCNYARKYKSQRGIDIDDDREGDFDFDVDRFGNQRSIFFDSEFIVDRIDIIDGKEYIIGIPVSLKDKGYEAKIAPIKVEEIYFTPNK
jgi:hypothetical protein